MSLPSVDRLESAFSAALSFRSEAERQVWLARLSQEAPLLAREVEGLLAAHARWGGQFEVPANVAYSSLLTTWNDDRCLRDSDLAAVLAQIGGCESSANMGRLGGYTLQTCVALGHTGFVFRAWDARLDRPVAIKVLAPSLAEDATRRRQFLNEARMASRIRHPHVVTIFHVSEEDTSGLVYFVMEWIPGTTLQNWLEQNPKRSDDLVLSMLDQIVQGVTAIHAAGIVHRDLKPGNVLRDESSGQLVIVDFGLAFEGHSDADLVAGTPLYMAPEQLLSGKVTFRSDLFSLGAITFLLVYRRHPFSGGTLAEVTARMMRETLELPESAGACEDGLRTVWRTCLAAEPENRYATAEEFCEVFRAAWAVARGLPDTMREIPWRIRLESEAGVHSVHAPKPNARSRLRMGSWVLLVLSGALIALACLWFGRSPVHGLLDPDTYVNSLGMRFRRVPAPAPIASWPPFSEHHELTERIDWRNIDRDFYLGECEVTRREFAAVMGNAAVATSPTLVEDQDLPMTGITFDEAELFCRKLTMLEPGPWTYHLPWEIEMTYAAYGFDLLSRGTPVATLVDSLPPVDDTIVAARRSSRSSLGLLGLSGNVWEWTDASIRKPSQWEGVVSFATTGEMPAEESRLVFGGGARDLFVHAYDMNCGINDFLERAENAHVHTEPDEVTKYLCPKSLDQPLRLVYHYTVSSPIRRAKLVNVAGLHVENSEFEIRVRKAGRQGMESVAEEWYSVFKHRGRLSVVPREFDLTEQFTGATEMWLEFRMHSDEAPRHYTQFARTNPILKLPNVGRFEAELQSTRRELRSQIAIPRSYRSPHIGFRVAMHLARTSDSSLTETRSGNEAERTKVCTLHEAPGLAHDSGGDAASPRASFALP